MAARIKEIPLEQSPAVYFPRPCLDLDVIGDRAVRLQVPRVLPRLQTSLGRVSNNVGRLARPATCR